ncbi:hypothetical protein C7B61_08900 [filamentous cyanobacterium CCP1]|nr:hypothetical protein C7B76_22005 [filamentous cyanobacterium CCP2]PSB66910.1 hypothetical protein C7B61_08900 [filamentous cyanobacterium CCP1]
MNREGQFFQNTFKIPHSDQTESMPIELVVIPEYPLPLGLKATLELDLNLPSYLICATDSELDLSIFVGLGWQPVHPHKPTSMGYLA